MSIGMASATIVQRLWNYCNVLRDDGMSYGDYVEQLTYLLSLKKSSVTFVNDEGETRREAQTIVRDDAKSPA